MGSTTFGPAERSGPRLSSIVPWGMTRKLDPEKRTWKIKWLYNYIYYKRNRLFFKFKETIHMHTLLNSLNMIYLILTYIITILKSNKKLNHGKSDLKLTSHHLKKMQFYYNNQFIARRKIYYSFTVFSILQFTFLLQIATATTNCKLNQSI